MRYIITALIFTGKKEASVHSKMSWKISRELAPILLTSYSKPSVLLTIFGSKALMNWQRSSVFQKLNWYRLTSVQRNKKGPG
jgi:hypothetical protein